MQWHSKNRNTKQNTCKQDVLSEEIEYYHSRGVMLTRDHGLDELPERLQKLGSSKDNGNDSVQMREWPMAASWLTPRKICAPE